ncbi:hypothetical protein SRHO_G00072340 [Serrasalmus rhombeus]
MPRIDKFPDIEVLESVNRALKPLQEFTDALSGEDYVSISYVQPVLQLLKTKTLAEDKEDSELTRSVKAKILDYMERKYEDSATQSLLDTSSFLDPRFKADISAENLIEIKAKLMAEMKTTQMEREPVFDATAEVQTGSPQSHGAQSEKRKKRTLGSMLQSAIPSTSSSVPLPTGTDQAVVESEFNSYLLMPTIDSCMDKQHFTQYT